MVLFLCSERGETNVRRTEYSKKLMDRDYKILAVMLVVLVVLIIFDRNAAEWAVATAAWIAQIAISTGAYYWKSKSENLVKLPILLLKDLPEDMRERADPNQIISAVLGIGTNNNNT